MSINFNPYYNGKKDITSKQWQLIQKIEKKLHIKFNGHDRHEAAKFIEKNFEIYKNAPTERQLAFISDMVSYGCPKFKGRTFSEASSYINENRELYKEQKQFMS